MITTKFILRTDKPKKDGNCPLFIRITKARKHAYINLGINLLDEQWNKDRQKIRGSYPNYVRANNYLLSIQSKLEAIALDYISKEKFFSAKIIKDIYLNKNSDNLIDIAKKWIENRKQEQTINHTTKIKYEGIIAKLSEYSKDKLTLNEFHTGFLKGFEGFLREVKENKVNTVASNLSCLRALTNSLIEERIIKVNDNPFLGYKFRFEKTKRKYLLPEQIKKIQDLVLEGDSKLKESHAIFLFCLETGLRIGDALHLKDENYDGSHLSYKCQKTKSIERLLLTLRAKKLLNKYLKKNNHTPYAFDFLNTLKQKDSEESSLNDQKSATALINKNLKLISTKLKLGLKLSTHFARHSMATNAITKGLSLEEIKSILGHSDIKTTQRYAKVIDLVKDDAIRKMDNS